MGIITTKTAADYLAQLQASVRSQSQVVADVSVGAIVDTMLGPTSAVAELGNADARNIEGLITLENPEAYTTAELAPTLARDGVTIAQSGRASGYLVYYRVPKGDEQSATNPSGFVPSDIVRGNPVGSSTSSNGQAATVFTTETRSWSQASMKAERGRYELLVPAQATAPGTRGNQAANRYTRPLRALPDGWDGVTNLERFTGGTDSETNTRAAGRAALAVRGAQKSTPAGIERLLKDALSDISSIRVVYGADERLERGLSKPNAVDVWIKSTNTASVTETLVYAGAGALHTLSQQPVASISSVVINGTTYTEGTDWEFTQDSGVESRSIRALDGVTVLSSTPTAGQSMTVTYTVNSTVRQAQAALNTAETESLGADVLVRAAIPVDFYIAGRLRPVSGNDFAAVRTLVREAILAFINEDHALDDDIELFDLISVIDNNDDITGIDNFKLDRLSISASDSTVDDRALAVNEYALLQEANLIITEY